MHTDVRAALRRCVFEGLAHDDRLIPSASLRAALLDARAALAASPQEQAEPVAVVAGDPRNPKFADVFIGPPQFTKVVKLPAGTALYASPKPAQAEPAGYVDCGECPRISTGCMVRCAKLAAAPKRTEG